MASAISTVSLQCAGLTIRGSATRDGDGADTREIALPAGKVGQLTTRTDNETGTLTMASGHGITTGAIIDLYWATGARYGILVGTVSTNSVPIGADNSGTGDNLPTNLTAIVACVQVPFNVAIDGDNVQLLGVKTEYTDTTETSDSRVGFLDVSEASIASLSLEANSPQIYDVAGGATNPFTGNPITHAVASNGSSANAATLLIGFIQDSTP